MFWGLKIEPEKRYTQTVVDAFHISQAAIDILSVKDDASPVQVMVEYENTSHLLASLSKAAKIYQVHLDLNFEKGDRVSFYTVGQGTVHLTGYHVIDDEDMEDRLMQAHGLDEESDELEDEDETENSSFDDSVGVLGKRKKALKALMAGKGKKSKMDSSDEDDDEENDEFGSTLGDSTLMELAAAEEESDDDDDEDGEEEEISDEEEDDEDSEELDSDAEEAESPKKPVTNGNTPNKKGKAAAKTPEIKAKGKKELNQSQQQTPKPSKTPKGEKTPKTTEKTPKSEKKTPKQDGATPKQDKGKKTPVVGGSPQKKVLQGGVVAEELKTGEGALAKSGKMVQVYYVGRLKSNNKQFDAATGGPGFKFRLGRAEVIRGWDVGVEGMRVGGKRRLTIPAAQAYGSKGSPPVIPPNSTLVFDVELRNVS